MCGGRLKLPTKSTRSPGGLQDLRDLEGHRPAEGVPGDGVRSVRLTLPDGRHVRLDHLREGGEGLLALVEAAGPQRVEGAVAHEVLGEVDEDQHLADPGVHAEQRGLLPAELHRHDGIVRLPLRPQVLGELRGERAHGGGRQHVDDPQTVGAQAPGGHGAQPQDVQGRPAQVEEVRVGADRARTGVEQLGVDFGQRLFGPALGGRVAAESAPGDLGHPPYDVVVGARLQPFPHERAPDLAEAGLGEGVLRQRKDQGRPEPPVHDRGGAHGGQRAEEVRVVARVGRLARVVEGDHQVFRVTSGGPGREGGDVRARHAVQLCERGLQFVAEVADPVDDDAVLAASHQGQPVSIRPRSPLRNQPSSVRDSAVARSSRW